MEKIASFTVNHNILTPGVYISRVDMDDIVTYDLRLKHPNQGDFLTPAVAHTAEHLFATYIRSCPIGKNVIYFGPMGCLTGFYLILKGVSHETALAHIKEAAKFLRDYRGEIPGSQPIECGNYLLHDLDGCNREFAAYYDVIAGNTTDNLVYPK